MTRGPLSACRIFSSAFTKIQYTVAVLALLAVSGLAGHLLALQQAPARGPKIWLGERQQLPMQPGGAPAAKAGLSSATVASANAPAAGQPLSLLAADVDEDGTPDLLVGYNGYIAIQRGNVDAFAPQSDESFQAISHGQFPAPFLSQQTTLNTPVNPDFIAVGHFTPSGHNDLVIAAKGSSALYVFAGDGKGNFASPAQVKLPGAVTVMAGGDLGHAQAFKQIVVGINATSGSELAIFTGGADGLDPVAAFPLSGPATSLNFADFGDGGIDLAFLAGGKVQILRAATMKVQQVSLPFTASALAVGKFVNDRIPGQQLALLTSDGALHIAAHNEFDPRAYTVDELKTMRKGARVLGEVNPLQPVKAFPVNGWKIVEDINAVGTFPAGQSPVLFRTKISDHQMDDVMVLNGASGLLTVVQHPDLDPGAETFLPAVLSTRPYSGSPIAAIPQRLNIDHRAGVLAIHAGESAPSMLMPLPDPTFVVNTTTDLVSANPNACLNAVAGQCSLRQAILEANANNNGATTTDTITVPAGTYTLTIPRVAGDQTGNHGTLEITDSVNIVGGGQATTIIQGGASLATSVDKVLSINEDVNVITSASVSLSNLTIQNGSNKGDCCGPNFDGFGGAFDFDTGTTGSANLTMDHVTIQNNAIFDGRGGGIAVFNVTSPGPGTVTITNSIIQNNDGTSNGSCCGEGGGIMTDVHTVMSMSNTQVLNNHTHLSGSILPEGGGIFLQGQHKTSQNHISGGSISGNTAAGKGGGISSTANLLMDGGTLVSNNTAGDTGAGAFHAGGGGIANDASDGLTLNNVTFTGNSTTGNGGGLFTGDGSGLFNPNPVNGHDGTVRIAFSRFAGNSASTTPGSSNLFNVTDTIAGNGNPVIASNNWWGSNVPVNSISQGGSPAVSTCPAPSTSSVVCFDPFIVLTNHGNPSKIKLNQTSTLTADMSADNHGTSVGLANLNQIVGLPITFAPGPLGTIPAGQLSQTLNPSAQAIATFTAGGTSGRANPTGTVDQGTALANDSLIAAASEVGTTVTITTVGAHGFSAGDTAVISGVGVGGYNGTFTIVATPLANTFTYTDVTSGLGPSSGGTANVGIVILQPPQITKTFGAATIPVNGTTTVNFSINNPNVVAINTSFNDLLPTGLQVSASPTVTNTCGGTVTAVAGAGSISFSNNLTAVGTCAISVTITGTVDNQYTNSVQILSTDAGNGNTSSANLTVINPPTIAKAFAAASIPLNGTTSLTFTVSSTNQNLTLNGVAFTDNLPAGLVVATPPNVGGSCTGTVTAVAGSSSISLSGQSLPSGATCTVIVDVQGTTAGVKNNSVQVTSTNGGTGNTSNASITVVAPPTIAKAFGAASIPLNGSTSLSFTITNPNATVALTGVAFSDTLPAGLVVSTPNGLTGSCGGGTITATAGSNTISLSGATVAASASCTFSVNVTGTAAGLQTNTTGAVSSTNGGTGNTATASLKVEAPPSIAKVFNPSTIALNATTSLTFTITNPAANVDPLTGVAFTDTLPTGLTVANATATVCGGTLTTTAPTGIALTGATIAVGGQCQFSVTVTGAVSGQYTNTTGAVTSTNGGTGNTATANLTVATPPSIAKAFGAATIPLNGTTSLTFTITNPNTTLALTGIAFTDNLPAGLVVATPNGLNSTCGGTATATSGSGSVSLSAGTLAASASCTVSINVQGTTAGVKNNSVQVTSTEGGTGNTSNASITVVAPPTIAKAFGAASIPLNGSTSLSFTLTNPNTTVALTGVAFNDTLPAGLVISTPNGLTGSCGAGTITATAGTNVISLSGGTIAANASCTFSVNVTGTAAGLQTNTTSSVTSTEGGTGNTATASVNVVAPPSIAKVFNPSTIALNATTSLTFTITNPAANAVSLTGVAFTDTLPTGLTVANATATVCGGTLTTTAPTGIALTGATIAANGQCQFSVTVTGAASGQYTNTTGAVTSTNGGTGNTATANLTVASPPSITKAFGAASIPLNGTTSLTFNITNPNTNVTLSGIAFTDNLPAGLVVASTPNLSNTCGGTATAVGGAGTVSLSAGTLATSANCTISVTVQGTTAGVKNNSVQVTSTEGGTGNTSNASITVVGAPIIIKAFGAASIPLNGSTSLSFTIQNNNTISLSGIGFSDTLPAGLVISTPNGLTGSCGGGTITATQSTNVISLTGATLAASTSCTFSVNVTGIAAGLQNNTTGNVTSTEGGTGGTASASVKVEAPPSIAKVFNPSSIALNATTSLTFTITNPAANVDPLNGVAFTDTLPTGLTVANATATVCGGTLTTTAPTGISLSGATIAVNGQCQFSVTVTGAAAGQYTNTTGAVTSTNGGTGNTASANLSVATPPTISKAFGAAAITVGGSTSLSFTINNPNASTSLSGIAFTDNLPAGLVVSTPNGLTGSCGTGTITAAAGASSLSLTGGTLAANASCTFSVSITGTTGGVKNNTTGAISATESGQGATSNTATITVTAPPVIIKAFGAATIPLNGSTSLQFIIQNNNATTSLSGIGFTDTLPAGLVVSTPNGLTGSCGGGTITATAGSGNVSLSGATLAASTTCTFSVNVTGTTAGTKNNTTSNVTSTEGGTGGTASASIHVEGPPSIFKAFEPTIIGVNGVSTLTFTITNPVANPDALNGVAFTDTLPTGLVVATPNGVGGSCTGTVTAVAGSGSISLTGATIATSSSCTVIANVTGSAVGTYNNTSGAVTSTNGGTGNTASATLQIAPANLAITKTHNGTFHRGQTGAQYFITVKNSSGAGPTVGTVTVVDNLPVIGNPHNIVPTDISGTGWTCTLATLTCTRSDVLTPGVSYPAITMTVNIPQNITNNFTNTATVSGGGDPNNHTASDPVSLGPPIQITPHSTSSSVKAGAAATFQFDVEDDDATLGMVAFGCSGLPVGTACVFNPPATNQPLSTVTMTLTTSGSASNQITSQLLNGPNPRLYAILSFPVFGLVALVFRGNKSRKTKLRLVFAFVGMITLLGLAGCGGAHRLTTPDGTFTITVTGATTTVQATTQVSLTVQ